MQNILVVVDMQNDFIDGALGTGEAVGIVPKVAERIRDFEGKVYFTRDTHGEDYLDTQEGRNLPVKHCIRGTAGWQIRPELEMIRPGTKIDKPSFGSQALGLALLEEHEREPIGSVTFVGLCTDICVISNALLVKAFLPEVLIIVDASCCAGVTPDRHSVALEAMKCCQVQVINEGSDTFRNRG